MTEKYVEVLITEGTNIGRSYKYEGNIYLVTSYEADRLLEEGKAVETSSIKTYRESRAKADDLTQKLQDDYDKINKSERLSPQGKKEDVEKLLADYQVKADMLQAEFTDKLSIIEKAEQTKLHQAPSNSKIDSGEAKTQAGIIKGELAMIESFPDAVALITQRQSTMDPLVARELLADFVTIKRELEEKLDPREAYTSAKGGISATKRVQIADLHEALKQTAYGPEQAKASERVKLIGAIRQQRGNITSYYERTVMTMKRAHGII